MNFVPDTASLVQFAVAAFIIAITPGPDMTLFVGRAISGGRAAGLACMGGAMTGILVHTLLVSLGLSALLVASPAAFLTLKIVGAAYLIYLAYQAIRHGSALSLKSGREPQRSLLADWLKGIAVNLLNPKVALFFMTFLPQFVSASDPYAPQKLLFLGLLFIPLVLPVTLPMVLAADGFSRLLRRAPRVTRLVDFLFAGVFATFAFKILSAQAK